MRTHYIAYFSPAGTTRSVAQMIEAALHKHGIKAVVLDLAPHGGADMAALAAGVETDACLWLGTPVYVDHAVPQVLDFIAALPQGSEGATVVPFATWGAVCSGVTLLEMAQLLKKRGWATVGAAKVLAQHSSLWESAKPLGAGHPDADDAGKMGTLVEAVLHKLGTTPVAPLDTELLDYLPATYAAEAWGKSLNLTKAMLGKHQPDRSKCNACGTCVEICPTGAFTWEDGYPMVGGSCVRCHQCTRHCPQQAFAYPGTIMDTRLHEMAAQSPEKAETAIYI
ncbi:MAG: 4Fe-4S binding protein [Desulfuromonadaceae bacterium]|nr:4Fe-4S binding protein [Desulfuromonadaceae bacterium]